MGERGAGVQLEGCTHAPGAQIEVSEIWAARLVSWGKAIVLPDAAPVETAVPEVTHRDPTVGRRRR